MFIGLEFLQNAVDTFTHKLVLACQRSPISEDIWDVHCIVVGWENINIWE